VRSIRKEIFRALYGVFAPDPYLHDFSILANVFSSVLYKTGGSGIIISESRDTILNHRLDAEWFALKSSSNARDKMERLNSLTVLGKTDNVAGLEIADLAVRRSNARLSEERTTMTGVLWRKSCSATMPGNTWDTVLLYCLKRQRLAPAAPAPTPVVIPHR
jgi:hypothetical protein